ncbi:MAG TPA: alpha/beta hydrolase-fold protein [Candidatus Solibacter sp.]|nr:alpha/beta hydrolase-fold protein [Candidatus Solibacter sp.]
MPQRNALASAVAAGLLCLTAHAQPQRAPRIPTPNDTLISPEVASDHRATFRIYAPKASEVTLGGDFLTGRATLEKDDKGVWSFTTEPLAPDFYNYSFTVDGVKTLDPKNPQLKPGISSNDNMFEVPGPEAAFEDTLPVPHGDVRIVWYQSSTLDTTRSMHIYTPPGYDAGNARYPVLYLLHGGGDDDAGWSTMGRAGFIMDNLLAAKKAKPMIVVMPNGSMPQRINGDFAVTPNGRAILPPGGSPQDKFADELLKNIVPYVEKNYRVLASQQNRAIAGLSMGGGQTLRVAPRNPDLFAYIAVWSAGLNPQTTADFEQLNAAFLDHADKTNKNVKVFWVGVGEKDTLTNASAKNLVAVLNKHGIKNEFHESSGAHTWINWRHYLNDYAPLLFR